MGLLDQRNNTEGLLGYDLPQEEQNLKQQLLGSVQRASPQDEQGFFNPNDMRWGETLPDGTVHLNTQKFAQALPKYHQNRYQPKMMLGESLHNLKKVAPERYERMYQAAMSDPKYRQWMQESYDYSKDDYGEERPIEDWHKASRFDQVVGGYLFAGEEDLPSMQDWDRPTMRIGDEFRKELELLRQDLGME